MTEPFDLEIVYNYQPQTFVANLLLQGYTHKFRVLIGETEVFFEPDEEGSYRAIKMPDQDEKELQKIDKALLQEIGKKIESILS